MNTISGLDDFKSGTIDVDGEVVTKFGSDIQERIRNEKFGYIFQKNKRCIKIYTFSILLLQVHHLL